MSNISFSILAIDHLVLTGSILSVVVGSTERRGCIRHISPNCLVTKATSQLMVFEPHFGFHCVDHSRARSTLSLKSRFREINFCTSAGGNPISSAACLVLIPSAIRRKNCHCVRGLPMPNSFLSGPVHTE